MTRLYTTPLPDSQATSSDEGVRAQIQQSGLLEAGGTATEKISADSIDLVIEGVIEFGGRFSRKVADELESLGESDYSGLPVYTEGGGGRNTGYYELEQVDVSPSHPVNSDAFEYTVGLKYRGSRADVWSGVASNSESLGTGLATGSNSVIGLPSGARKVRWFSESAGKEAATVSSTVTAEYGSVDRYDPTSTSLTNPMLLYELPYSSTGSVDVRVYDDHARSKYYTIGTSGGDAYGTGAYGAGVYGGGGTGEEISQWTHAYHTSFEFAGDPVVDNGLLRLRFDETNDAIEFYEWDASNSVWSQVSVSHTNYELIDADLERIGPADVRAFAEFQNTSDGSLRQALLSVQRGLSRVVAREPVNDTWTTGFEDYLAQFCGSYTTDLNPARALKARGEVK